MREIPSKMEFHGLLCQKGDANSDRNAHWIIWLNFEFRFPVQRKTKTREAGFSVSSSPHRVRVMEARFDGGIIRLPKRARAIGGVMFRREAWGDRSELVIGTCCRLMP